MAEGLPAEPAWGTREPTSPHAGVGNRHALAGISRPRCRVAGAGGCWPPTGQGLGSRVGTWAACRVRGGRGQASPWKSWVTLPFAGLRSTPATREQPWSLGLAWEGRRGSGRLRSSVWVWVGRVGPASPSPCAPLFLSCRHRPWARHFLKKRKHMSPHFLSEGRQ